MRTVALICVTVAALSVAGCDMMMLEGSGNIVSEPRDVSGFNSVSLKGVGELTVRQTGSESLTVTTDDNLLEHVETEVRDGNLSIGFSSKAARVILKPSAPIRFELTVEDLDALSISGSGEIVSESLEGEDMRIAVSGSGDVRIGTLDAETLTVAISGSGDVSLEGRAGSQSIAVSGSGHYRGGRLVSATVSASVSGSGDVTVWATDELEAHVSGSGSVGYYGDPEVERRVSGAGSVRRLGSGGAEI